MGVISETSRMLSLEQVGGPLAGVLPFCLLLYLLPKFTINSTFQHSFRVGF